MSFVQPVKIAVVGAGKAGASFAYAALLRGLASELVLIDKDVARAEGEAMDLQHTIPFSQPAEIRAGTLLDTAGSAITVICAGKRLNPGQTPSDVLEPNAAVIKEIIPQIADVNPDGIIIVATNPVDVLTYGAWKLSGLSRRQVIGTGTILETARFRYLLGRHFRIEPRSVHAYILGENGQSEVPIWSSASIAGMPLTEICKAHGCDASALDDIFDVTRNSGAAVLERKGSPNNAIATALVRMVEAILHDEKAVFSVSSVLLGEYGMSEVALSVPTVLSREGVDRILRVQLNDREVAELLLSGRKIHSAINFADFVVKGALKAS
ncbi:MAG TPA: L-lactate dehydrogenase [Candidatus Angelobacter sp.]